MTAFNPHSFFTKSIFSLEALHLIIYLINPTEVLKVRIERLEGESTVIFITNKEKETIELKEVTINHRFSMVKFADKDYYSNWNLGRGKKYIEPEEVIILFTSLFYDYDGYKFNPETTELTRVTVVAKVGKDLRSKYGGF